MAKLNMAYIIGITLENIQVCLRDSKHERDECCKVKSIKISDPLSDLGSCVSRVSTSGMLIVDLYLDFDPSLPSFG